MKKSKYIYKAIKIKLFPTKKKQKLIKKLIHCIRKTINQYLKLFVNNQPELNKNTLNLITKTQLSERHKSNALKQAIEIYKSDQNKTDISH